MTTLASWNVNGIRAIHRKGFLDWLAADQPDIVCVQETKAMPEQVPEEMLAPPGYQTFWQSAVRKGYSGVATFAKTAPLETGVLGVEEFDAEGRVQTLRYPGFVLINAYFPNSQEAGARLEYKVAFCNALLEYCNRLTRNGEHVIVCGDYNIAHKPIDLKNPERNEKNPGYLPEERAWMDTFVGQGYVDTFRLFCDEPGHYSWWSYRFQARAKGIGWRIDYHCVDDGLRDKVTAASIQDEVMGSDHCPVLLEVDA